MGLKNEFETSMVNEPSVLQPLKVYCICCCFWSLKAHVMNQIYYKQNLAQAMKDITYISATLHATCKYSQTCLKGSPKGRAKIGCLGQVTP